MKPTLRFLRHLVEMVVAMTAGMLLLSPVWNAAWPGLHGRPAAHALVMATNMSVGMAAWMRVRRHGWRAITEMCGAMYAPFLLLLFPYAAGMLDGGALMSLGHLLMLPAMTLVMLRRRSEYTHAHPLPTRLIRVGVLVVAAVLPPLLVGAVVARSNASSVYAPASARSDLRPAPSPSHDPAKPTAAVVVGTRGANVADALAPYEVLAATGAFNVYTVAPARSPVPLTGGLDLLPDLSFADLDARLDGRPADVVVVPAMPDASEPAVLAWLRGQAGRGAVTLSVCYGARVAAAAGILDGHEATSHWFHLGGLKRSHSSVSWRNGVRYVDDGAVVSTAGVLSGVDGTLRVVERFLGTDRARAAATAVGWTHYVPGSPAPLPVQRFGPGDAVAGLNLAFRWDVPRVGVLLTDGVGEVELASVFGSYTEATYAARTVAVGLTHSPVRSRHGLTFVPRESVVDRPALDRLLVPGVNAAAHSGGDVLAAAAATGLTPEYPHRDGGFAFGAVLRDVAATTDVPTAAWRAKLLEYPAGELDLAGPSWPWATTVRPLVLALVGLVLGLVALRVARPWADRRRRERHVRPSTSSEPSLTA
ncbi:DJ-1/PfpI family protein [Micromonospora sp. NPDC047730]|uniref:DJ-1/PfpI family protein n=1 Tax=Micromonospora sp. NPDC047730 TaxID=3364253 RepID=UPI003722DD6F